jgi:hypothetical protein
MSGRVSIKGQGADIFFGDYTGKHSDPNRSSELAGSPPANLETPKSKPARMPAGQASSQLESQHASQPASQGASMQAPELVGQESPAVKRRLRNLLEREHRTHNTYRYHEDELNAVRDIVYELEVRHGAKVSRNDVMRAALLWAIDDYVERGEHSLLVQLLKGED